MSTNLGPVLVCKEYSDSYAVELSNRGFEPHFLQILETRFVNEDLLRQTIEEGPNKYSDGVIVTSSKAAEAWINASSSIQETQVIGTSSNGSSSPSFWFDYRANRLLSQLE
jgi:uroporphyrinogen-III synthase